MKQLFSIFAVLVIALGSAGMTHAEGSDSNPVLPIVEVVNINEADAETIAMVLHRVGIKRAQDIVDWREANGKFTSVEQLLEIKGIGKATLEANRERIRL